MPPWDELYGSQVAQMVKYRPAMWEAGVRSLHQEDPLEKGMATHSSILAWKSHGQRSLEGHRPRGHKESDTSKRLTLSLSFTSATEQQEQTRILPY